MHAATSRRHSRRAAEAAHEALAELARRRLSHFVRQAWRILEPDEPLIWGWYLDAVCEHLEAVADGQIKRLLINVPPRTLKSTITSQCFPAWVWLRNPHARFLTASYASTLATRDAVVARDLIHSHWYAGLNRRKGKPIFRVRTDGDPQTKKLKDEQHWYANDQRGYRIAFGVDGGATGHGATIGLVDDPHNPKQALSDAERDHAIRFMERTLPSRLNNQKTGAIIVIMQRLHQRDVSGYLISKQLGYEHLCLPMEFDPKRRCVTSLGTVDPRTKAGESLCAERFPPEVTSALQTALTPIGYAGQYNQAPAPEGGTVFKRDQWRFWSSMPAKFEHLLMSWDCAFKDLDTSSYVVGQVWGFVGAQAYLLDQVRDHMDLPATIAAFRALADKWPRVLEKLVEDKANGPAVIQSLKNEIPGIIPVGVSGSKLARAQAVSPLVAAGNVLLPESAPWLSDYLEELSMFPRSANDDQVDATTQALAHRYLRDQGEDAAALTEAIVGKAGKL